MHRIAVVEDDVETSRLIGDALRESGYETVSYFHPSSDIIEHLHTFAPDLAILDARLHSSVTGWDIIEAMKADVRTAHIRIILCSGATNEIHAHAALLKSLNVPVLSKPFDLEDLYSLVAQELAL